MKEQSISKDICTHLVILKTQEFTFFSQEEDILDMIAECEADEKDGKGGVNKVQRGPKVSQQAQLVHLFSGLQHLFLQFYKKPR